MTPFISYASSAAWLDHAPFVSHSQTFFYNSAAVCVPETHTIDPEGVEDNVRVVGTDGIEVAFPRPAAMESGLLAGWMEDLDDDMGAFPVPGVDSTVLRAALEICQRAALQKAAPAAAPAPTNSAPTATSPPPAAIDERAFELLRLAKFLDMPAVSHEAGRTLASIFNGRTAEEIRTILGIESAPTPAEQAAALSEPLYSKPPEHSADGGAPPLLSARGPPALGKQPTFGQRLGDDDAIDICLAHVDAHTLRTLKAVSSTWRRRASWVLSEPMSMWRRAPIWNAPVWSYAAARDGDFEKLRTLDTCTELPAHVEALASALGNVQPGSTLGAHTTRTTKGAAARGLLSTLEPAIRVDCAVRLLAHPTPLVRAWAAGLMHEIREPTLLAPHALMSVLRLHDPDPQTQVAGSLVLDRLDPQALSSDKVQHELLAALASETRGARTAAVQILAKLDEAARLKCLPSIAALLGHADEGVCSSAASALRALPPSSLAPHAPALAQLIHTPSDAACEALRTLCTLEPSALAPHIDDAIKPALVWLPFWIEACA